MATKARRSRARARRGSGSIRPRGQRFHAQIDLGVGADGKRTRRTKSFATQAEAQAWLDEQRAQGAKLTAPVADQRLDDYLNRPLGAAGLVAVPPASVGVSQRRRDREQHDGVRLGTQVVCGRGDGSPVMLAELELAVSGSHDDVAQ